MNLHCSVSTSVNWINGFVIEAKQKNFDFANSSLDHQKKYYSSKRYRIERKLLNLAKMNWSHDCFLINHVRASDLFFLLLDKIYLFWKPQHFVVFTEIY